MAWFSIDAITPFQGSEFGYESSYNSAAISNEPLFQQQKKSAVVTRIENTAPASTAQAVSIKSPQKFNVSFRTNPVDKYTQEDLPKIFREPVNPSSWTNDPKILKNAPDPYFELKGKKTLAKCVVDITNCRLYVYDNSGKAIESFRVATGAPDSPTRPGVRKVLKKQIYPYSDCEPGTKRRRYPYDYGPKIAYLNAVDTSTGTMNDDGGYLHGTRHEEAVARTNRHVTHGCVRLHNRDTLYVVNDVLKYGDYLKYVK